MHEPHLAATETTLIGGQLVRPHRIPQRARRHGDQRRRQALCQPEQPAPRSGGDRAARRRGDLPEGAHHAVAAGGRAGRAHAAAATGPARAGRARDHAGSGAGGAEHVGDAAAGRVGDGGEGGGDVHLPRPRDLGVRPGSARRGPARAGLRSAARAAHGGLGPAVAALRHRHRAARRQRRHAHDAAPAHPAPAADHLDAQHRPGRGRAGARLARRGLPRPHLLGRAVHLPAAQLPHPRDHARLADLPPSAAEGGALRGAGRRLPGRAVPVAERQQRARGKPGRAPEPEIGPLGAGRDLPAAPRQRRDRLQHLAVRRGHARQRVRAFRRRGDVPGDRALLGQRGALQRPARPLRDPGRGRARRVPHAHSRSRRARAGQQQLHQRDGGVDPVAGAGTAAVPARRPARGVDAAPGHRRGRDGAMGRDQPQDAHCLPCRRRDQSVRGLRGAARVRLGGLCRQARRHPAPGPPARGRRQVGQRGTRPRSRPTC